MSMSRFLLTILRPRSPTVASHIPIKLRTSLDRAARLPRLLRDIHRRPKAALLKVPALATLTSLRVIGAISDIGAIASSIGPGNTGSDFVIRLSPIQKGTSVEKKHPRSPKHTIWEGCNGNSVRQTGCSDKTPPEKTPDRTVDISSLPATSQERSRRQKLRQRKNREHNSQTEFPASRQRRGKARQDGADDRRPRPQRNPNPPKDREIRLNSSAI
jgi:hypothetical protein